MSIENLKTMKEQLMSCTQSQLSDISRVDTHEMGEAIDMIKDLSEAIYYCTITEAMQKADEAKNSSETNINYYTNPEIYRRMNYYTPDEYYRNMERNRGYMYYTTGTGTGTPVGGNNNYYTEMMNGGSPMMRDPREGRSPMRRRMYMEGKEAHNDTNSQLKELEAYLQELSTDITEMIKDASPEERATLHQKMTTLASKIS